MDAESFPPRGFLPDVSAATCAAFGRAGGKKPPNSPGPPNNPQFGFVAGLAFARLERWNDARNALEWSSQISNDCALVELAGVGAKEFGIMVTYRLLASRSE
jgi:hypothetical protein